ncbi:MAG TPA: hypothetical protein VJY41_08965 [Prolixibacteraceae bacterium]|nr:hypothetical protein [Prolixibacteraceae bacterium]
MTTIQINEKTKIGKSIVEMLRVLAKADSSVGGDLPIKFLDETGYLLASKANREALLHGVAQVDDGDMGKQIQIKDMWK